MKPGTTAVTVGAVAAIGIAALLALREGEPPDAPPANTSTTSSPTRATPSGATGSPTTPDEPPEELPFSALPPEHQPDRIRAALEGIDGWPGEAWPEARATWLGTDCGAPPCLIGLRFEPPAGRDGELAASFRDELEQRLGWRPWGVLSTEDGEVHYAWMFGVPEELLANGREGQRQALTDSAGERFSRLMERAGIDPADPVRAE